MNVVEEAELEAAALISVLEDQEKNTGVSRNGDEVMEEAQAQAHMQANQRVDLGQPKSYGQEGPRRCSFTCSNVINSSVE